MGKSSESRDRKNPKKVKCDGPTDGPTDGLTDRRTDGTTKQGVESRSTQLKNFKSLNLIRTDELREGPTTFKAAPSGIEDRKLS